MEVTPEAVRAGLAAAHYITTARVETVLFLALVLEKPLLVEGPAGAGKTELAKVVAAMLETELIRLQCYEGLDAARAAGRLGGTAEAAVRGTPRAPAVPVTRS